MPLPSQREAGEWLGGITKQAIRDLEVSIPGLRDRREAGDWKGYCGIACRHYREQAAGRASQSGDFDLVAERARLAKEQADEKALRNAMTRGEIVNAEDAAAAGAAIASGVAERIMGLRTLAPVIRAAGSDEEGAAILENGAREALEEIAHVGRIMGEAARKSGSDDRPGAVGHAAASGANGEPVGGRRAEALS